MSTPTVNALMEWLQGLFKLPLPTLPLSGVWTRFVALWDLPVPGGLPDPKAPLPWSVGVEPNWSMPVSGVRLVPAEIQILVKPGAGSLARSGPLAAPGQVKRGSRPSKGSATKTLGKRRKTK